MRWVKFGAVGVLLVLAFGVSAHMSMEEEAALRRAGVRTDAEGLREFFRSRTIDEALTTRMKALIRRLGADDFDQRQKASGELIDAGRIAASFLRAAKADPDPEVRARARRVLFRIDEKPEAERIATMARLIRERRTPGALPILLDFMPSLKEPEVEQDLLDTISELGLFLGKADPAILAAAKGREDRKRMAAAWALGQSLLSSDRRKAANLLGDASFDVRLRAAQGLVYGEDSRGVGGLIDLLTGAPLEIAERAEWMLAVLSKKSAPSILLGLEEVDRQKCQSAWRDWETKIGKKLDLAKIRWPVRAKGFRLVVSNNGYGGGGAVWEYSPDRPTLWFFNRVVGPVDAHSLPNGNVLVAEYNARRITERDRKGRVQWSYANLPTFPHDVQPLADGNVLIVTAKGIIEVDRAKETVFSFAIRKRLQEEIYSGQKLADGNYLLVMSSGRVLEIDAEGITVHRFWIPAPIGLTTIEELPGGRYLVPNTNKDRVEIVDREGKVLRHVRADQPTSAAMLPNGNILIGSYKHNAIVEIDAKGEKVWEDRAGGQVTRVRVR